MQDNNTPTEDAPDLDNLATAAMPVTTGAGNAAEMKMMQRRKQAVLKHEWNTNIPKFLAKRVALPSAALALVAYGLKYEFNKQNIPVELYTQNAYMLKDAGLSVAAGLAYGVSQFVSAPAARFAGRALGTIYNALHEGVYFQQITKELTVEASTRTALAAFFATSPMLYPTYGQTISDITSGGAAIVREGYNIIDSGIRHRNDDKIEVPFRAPVQQPSSIAPAPKQDLSPAQP